jgi:arsenate reductase-like glutaredoxin family protein
VKAQGFLATNKIEIATVVDAKAKLGAADAVRLARESSAVIVSKGKKVTKFSMNKDRPGDAELLEHMLGPTGNLRAPTVQVGKTLLVGFNEDEYQSVFA